MPAKSKKQQMAAGAALAAKRGKRSKSSLKGASRQMAKSMSKSELRKMAKTKRKGKPTRKRKKGWRLPSSFSIGVAATSDRGCRSKERVRDYPWERSMNCLEKQGYAHEKLQQFLSFCLHDLDYLPKGFRTDLACPGERMIKHIDQK